MPLFMDRHELGVGTTAEDVARAHMADLGIQDKFGAKYVSYWFDHATGAAFCLVEADSAEIASAVHAESHGMVANQIIPVDEQAVFGFYGEVSDPTEKGTPPDSPFRTVLFTDMEGSTELTQRLGDAAAMDLVRTHDTVIRDALGNHQGREVKHTGDGIMAAFDSVSRALQAAAEVQQALVGQGSPISVKIGISAGEPVAEGDDLFGATVQLASRLTDKANGGEILVSTTVRDLALGKGFAFGPSDVWELKGFPQPVEACRLDWE
ncbi:MAG: DUF4242 domain-containing protein [Acidimicrobiia bacterium]|nr:DUF4242 domain-containing protein [Acidimicrobiia bacterium]NNC74297.1 DUF4242 domain-containing protein [Acidimicrobiia bacterium]